MRVMREQAKKLQPVAEKLAKAKGKIVLFALFLRENGIDKWDVLVSSDWARRDKRAALEVVIEEMKTVLDDKEWRMLAKVVILDKNDSMLDEVKSATRTVQGVEEFSNRHFFDLDIKQGYLIDSK